MPNLTIKNLPREVHERLKRQAQAIAQLLRFATKRLELVAGLRQIGQHVLHRPKRSVIELQRRPGRQAKLNLERVQAILQILLAGK